jgi:hypothetical protein
VGQLREVSNKAQNAELKLFLEVYLGLVTICWTCTSCYACYLFWCLLWYSAVESLLISVHSFRIYSLSLFLRSTWMTFFFSSNSTTQKRKNLGTTSISHWLHCHLVLSSASLCSIRINVSFCDSLHCDIYAVLQGDSLWRPWANLQISWQN